MITITEEILDKCTIFAKDCISTNKDKYASRNQFNESKITQDILNGKIAEQCVYDYLKNKVIDLTEPDYQIYSKSNKSWSPDLKTKNLSIAVKSQDLKSKISFGESWVFQQGNNSYDCDTEVFKNIENNNKYACFVSLNVPKRVAEIKAIVKIKFLHDNKLFKPMKLKHLSSKVAVYFEDLEKFDNLMEL